MYPQDELNPAERELEAALGRLRPAAPGVGREEVVYAAGLAAGRQVARRRALLWQATTGVLAAALALVVLTPASVMRPQGGPLAGGDAAGRTADVVPGDAGTRGWYLVDRGERPVDAAYLRLRERVLNEGLSALPAGTVRLATDEGDDVMGDYRRPPQRTLRPGGRYLELLKRMGGV